jgi:O-methyltransferase
MIRDYGNQTVNFFRKISHRVQTARLSKLSRAILRERLTYLTPKKLLRIERALNRIIDDNISGDMLEMGIALGGSGIVIANAAKEDGRKFYGFDVFGMIPEPSSNKDDDKSKQRYRIISSGRSVGIGGDAYYGYRNDLFDQVKASFAKYGAPVDGKGVVLLRGLFGDTLPTYYGDVAFAHIDCDWYDPVKLCLGLVATKLSSGGIIILDDYHDYGGAKAAVDEFLAGRSDFNFSDGVNVILQKR